MAIFRSDKAETRVSFPPEQFGYGKGIETVFDPQSGAHVQKQAPHRPVKFKNGVVDVSDARLPLMRKHPGNRANAGDNAVFWEESEKDTKALEAMFMQRAELPEGGLTDDDRQMLDALKRNCKHIAPPEAPNVRERIAKVIERFKVRGIEPCQPQYSLQRIKARAIELMGLLEDKGIYEGTATPDGSTGPSE